MGVVVAAAIIPATLEPAACFEPIVVVVDAGVFFKAAINSLCLYVSNLAFNILIVGRAEDEWIGVVGGCTLTEGDLSSSKPGGTGA